MELTRISRPLLFEHLIGNKDIFDTLRLNIANRELAPKIIVHGHPGVGKSSVGMVLALAGQCQNNMNGNPCLECDTCKEVIERLILNNENCCNIFKYNMSEMKTVEKAREILEILEYRKSSKYPYTFLILEEPQRMSIDAQDLLNVPLEYLQDHIRIIFTTTEINKLSEAIQSRSVVHKLKIPSLNETTDLLDRIVTDRYARTVPRQLLELIVEYSNNVPRDSIGNLEEVVKSGSISVETINKTLGMTNFDHYIRFFDVVHKDIMIVAKLLAELQEEGISYSDFVANLHIFMTDVFKMKFGVKNNRYTKQQYKKCRELFANFSYKEFMRLQILSTQVAMVTMQTAYQTERFAESQLYEFALKVNQNFDVDNYFRDSSNDHAVAVKAHSERKLENDIEKQQSQITGVSDILTEIANVSNTSVKVVRQSGEIKTDDDTNIIY